MSPRRESASVRECSGVDEWLRMALEMNLTAQQALSTWTALRGSASERPYRCGVFTGKSASKPEARARAYARSHAHRAVVCALEGDPSLIADAPVCVFAHDYPPKAGKEGGAKMFVCAPARFASESALGEFGGRAKVAREFFRRLRDAPDVDSAAAPASSLYAERCDGEPDLWTEASDEARTRKPYAVVIDIDGQHLVDGDASRYPLAGRMFCERGEWGEPLISQICDTLQNILRETIRGLRIAPLVFCSAGAKPSYRVYVRVAAPASWSHTRTIALVLADIREMKMVVRDRLLLALEGKEWFKSGVVDAGTFGKGWDRFVGMAKFAGRIEDMRPLGVDPVSSVSDPAAVSDWREAPSLTLLTSIGYVYDAPFSPISLNQVTSSRKRSSPHASSGATETTGARKVVEQVEKLIRTRMRWVGWETDSFRGETAKVSFAEDQKVQQVMVRCDADNRWCPWRAACRREHKTMTCGKVAVWIDKLDDDEAFAEARVNCFACRQGGSMFKLPKLLPAEKHALVESAFV